ncbi:galactose mutarotase-like protein [Fomitiporia mediterranea MF3/22]|uniref:galactose mutarotase-like protein n=1 Tax=Fomitiporia mediterranea (strain MF3/22) TaxID=694068 RepID=UPI0004407F92|nr:galactose mutarotase-like protein [Fomitiporia mediterranea MF3/22]EJD04665.1 galactose mutarotase-like protein [Fomitiporia mediterranea MF3/22]
MIARPFKILLSGLLLASTAAVAAEWPFDVTTITAPDNSVTAKFVSFGATMTELWVKDKFGKARDIILGYDDNSELLTDPAHPVFNPIVGRYANRIKNGLDTLHGGIYGWDRRNWTIVEKTASSVTYRHFDSADEGFPGDVTVFATHSVERGGILKTTVHASATALTPIMTTQHIYWNLDAFQQGSENILNHTLRVDGGKVLATDSIQIPTGDFINVGGTAFDFQEARQVGSRWADTIDYCGCQGYDNCWIYSKEEQTNSGVSLWSDLSGIRVDMTTNQPAVQVYTAYWLNTPRKVVHGGPTLNYTKWSAVAIEQEGIVDAVNNPVWGVNQICGPGKDFEWSTTYHFSVVH